MIFTPNTTDSSLRITKAFVNPALDAQMLIRIPAAWLNLNNTIILYHQIQSTSTLHENEPHKNNWCPQEETLIRTRGPDYDKKQ